MTKINVNDLTPKEAMTYFRNRMGLTKWQVCEALGVSRPTLNNIENRPYDIAIKYLEQLGDLYGEDFINYYIDNKLFYKSNR